MAHIHGTPAQKRPLPGTASWPALSWALPLRLRAPAAVPGLHCRSSAAGGDCRRVAQALSVVLVETALAPPGSLPSHVRWNQAVSVLGQVCLGSRLELC